MSDDRPGIRAPWWDDWGETVAFITLGILGLVAALTLAGWLVSLLL